MSDGDGYEKSTQEFLDALNADVAIPVTGESIFHLRQTIAGLRYENVGLRHERDALLAERDEAVSDDDEAPTGIRDQPRDLMAMAIESFRGHRSYAFRGYRSYDLADHIFGKLNKAGWWLVPVGDAERMISQEHPLNAKIAAERDKWKHKAELFDGMAQMVIEQWSGDITAERNTGPTGGGLPGVVRGVFEQRDRYKKALKRIARMGVHFAPARQIATDALEGSDA